MAQINQNRYETLATRALGIKGPGVFGHAEDAIFAGLALDTNAPVEMWYPQRIYRYAAGVLTASHATLFGGIELRNSSTDQLWIVDEVNASTYGGVAEWMLWVGEGTTADFYVNALLATNVDTRIAGASARDWGSSGTGLATIPGFGRIDIIRCLADTPCHFSPGVVLSPGGSFIINNERAAQANRLSIAFHTRQAMPGELS